MYVYLIHEIEPHEGDGVVGVFVAEGVAKAAAEAKAAKFDDTDDRWFRVDRWRVEDVPHGERGDSDRCWLYHRDEVGTRKAEGKWFTDTVYGPWKWEERA